jgi:hypothetical protein
VGLCGCVGGLEMSLLSVPGCWLLKMLYEDEFEIGIHHALHAPIIKA